MNYCDFLLYMDLLLFLDVYIKLTDIGTNIFLDYDNCITKVNFETEYTIFYYTQYIPISDDVKPDI
jgi:hypothetical protein